MLLEGEATGQTESNRDFFLAVREALTRYVAAPGCRPVASSLPMLTGLQHLWLFSSRHYLAAGVTRPRGYGYLPGDRAKSIRPFADDIHRGNLLAHSSRSSHWASTDLRRLPKHARVIVSKVAEKEYGYLAIASGCKRGAPRNSMLGVMSYRNRSDWGISA
jgi:hypothetical protein